jgi:hypothetical protein
MMIGSVWLPFEVTLALGFASLLIIFLMPESHKLESCLSTPIPEAENPDISDTQAAAPLDNLGNTRRDISSSIVRKWHNLQSVSFLG